MKRKYLISLFFLLLLNGFSCFSEEYAQEIATTSHIKQVLYKPNTIFTHRGFYGVATIMKFDQDEVITNLIMGDTTGWQIHDIGSKLVLKPVADEYIAETNAIIFIVVIIIARGQSG